MSKSSTNKAINKLNNTNVGMSEDYKQTEIGTIPIDWAVYSINQLVKEDIIAKPLDGNHGNIHPTCQDYVSDGIPFIMANNVRDGHLDLKNCCFITKERADKLQKGFAISGDVLITHKGTIGNIAIIGKIVTDYIMLTPQVTYYRVKNNNLLINQYIKYYFESNLFQTKLVNLSGGGTRAYIGITAQGTLPFVLPPLHEQKVITNILCEIDSLINSIEALIIKKHQIKQGAMQQLLSGKIRLDGFSGVWEEKPLGDVVDIRRGQMITEKNITQGLIPVIAGGKKPAYFHNKPNRFGKTITISASGASAGYIAFFDVPIFASDCSTIIEGHGYSIDFIYYWLHLNQGMIYKAQTGGAQPHIHPIDLMPLKIKVPSVKEQLAIVQILSDIDYEIEYLKQEFKKNKELKKGMMQELLTGKTRLV